MLKWFHNLKIAQKLALISVLFMIPDSIMLYLFITSINENIQFARLEQTGNEYQRPLESLLDLIPQHRLMARRLPAGKISRELTREEQQIDAAFETLRSVDARIGKKLDFTPEGLTKRNRQGCDLESVLSRWEALKAERGGISAEACDQRHVQLISDIRAMIAHAGDMSNLILDPELDSYYLMDVTLMALPQTQDRLSQVMADGEDFFHTSGQTQDRNKMKLAIDLTLLKQDDLDRISSSTQTALSNGNPLYGSNPTFHDCIPAMLKKYADAAGRFNELTERLQSGEQKSVTLQQYLAAGDAARTAGLEFWYVADQELDGMLQNRINYYAYRRTRSLGVAASALLAAILLVTFITKSISGPLKKQAAQLKAVNDALSIAREQLEKRVVKSHEALQRTEDKYRSIFENSVMGIFQTTPGGRYISVNPALARIYGYDSPAELIAGVTDIKRCLYVDSTRRDDFVQAIRKHGSVIDFQSEIYCKDGTIRWISETAREVRNAEGRLLYYEGTIEDIMQRKRAEAEEHRAQQDAEAARAAAELARAAAEAASVAKSDFLASMSHEIRTPLNGVIGMVELLSNTPLSAQQLRYAKVIQSSSDGLLTLINQILDFSKIEAGKLELDEENFNPHFAVEEVVVVLAQKAAAKGLELACRIDPSVPTQVLGDGDRIRQVLMNLLNNAIKFTTRGEVIVRVSAKDSESSPPPMPGQPVTLQFSVSDTGIGIPTDRMDRLFKGFSQVDASITRQYGGTGLGLAISKQLVELMGGTIAVESVAGKGSTFSFIVKVCQNESARETPFGLRGHRVLVVDDSLTQCQLLHEQFGSWGIEAAYATSAPAAIELLQAAVSRGRPFEVAIIDLNMPDMNGMEMARTLRASPSLSNIPRILMSGIEAEIDADANGFIRFLTKPIRQSLLLDALTKALTQPPALSWTAPAESAKPQPRAKTAKSTKILLAEDMEINQFVVTETLAREGYTCDIANNGREAILAASKKQYDLILMDCQMPEVSGFEATVAIRANEAKAGTTQPPVPIVALTANAVKGDRERCLAAGMNEYLTKPLNPTLLIQTIERFAGAQQYPPVASKIPHPKAKISDPALSNALSEVTFDYDSLLARCDGDTAMLSRLVQKFQEKSLQTWEQLLKGYQSGDVPLTTRLSHALKGTASNLSAMKVAALAERLEELGRAGDLSCAEAVVNHLAEELKSCRETFDTFLAKGGDSSNTSALRV